MSGLDTSSSASIAAYVTDLSRSLVGNGGGWLGRLSSSWKITSSTVCCWNAFSRLDVRVEISIPGGVRSYAVDTAGTTVPTTQQIWMETYVSSMLRSLQGGRADVKGLRRLTPFVGPEDEVRFLETARLCFEDGWKLGAPYASPQQATNVNNRLAQGLLEYFVAVQRPQAGVAFFRSLLERDAGVADLVAKCLFAMNAEAEAVRLLHGVLSTETDVAPLLRTLFDFLLERGEAEWAAQVIKQAIRLAPMDLEGWFRLARLHIAQGEYERALSTINSFPYVLVAEDEAAFVAPSASFWQPRLDPAAVDLSALEPASKRESLLEQLKAPALKGTSALAYRLLMAMCMALGWDELLRHRASVFVMEEEYVLNRSASCDPLAEDRRQVQRGKEKAEAPGPDDVHPPPPARTAAHAAPAAAAPQKKRLCERWLDALFLVVFEDLRVHAIYEAELRQAKEDSRAYRRTPREWIILGDLCRRMGQAEQAKEAYELCIGMGFSRVAWQNLMELWAAEGRLSHALTAAVHLLGDAANRLEGVAKPSFVSTQVLRMVRMHGQEKVRIAVGLVAAPEPANAVLLDCLAAAQRQHTIGSDF